VLDRSIVHVAANRWAYGVVGVVVAATASVLIGRMASLNPAFPIIGFTFVFIGMFALRLFPDNTNTWSVSFAKHALVITVALAIVVLIILAVVAAIVLVLRSGYDPPQPPTHGKITTNYTVCVGEYQDRCPANAVFIRCGESVAAWASKECVSFGELKLSDTPGNRCGYYLANVTCTKSQ
jgi:hypothetical protein